MSRTYNSINFFGNILGYDLTYFIWIARNYCVGV